ncbi:MAG TPA: 3-deoxy-8-phosphooctulonate synthase, partial [Cyclobacteriaceae bacterium]|nr:3-deoxy-8-phosphooctulonate synthase [Cyclobacteriaceae bacterium]
MEIFKNEVSISDSIKIGGNRMVLFAGPCAAESEEICLEVGSKVKSICEKLDIAYVFKASFDKANRTSA